MLATHAGGGWRITPVVLCLLSSVHALSGSIDDLLSKTTGLSGATEGHSVAPPPRADSYVDATKYMVGSGDVFYISVLDFPSVRYTASVNQNCDIFIPELGVLLLGKMTAAQAADSIRAMVRAKLSKKRDVYVVLSAVKTASVTVTGAVDNPGTYDLPGNYRLLDAIKRANGNVLPRYENTDYRRIACVNRGERTTHDLLRFLFADSLADNPYVYPGDNIVVSLATTRVYILGPTRSPLTNPIPIKIGETASDLLSLFPLDSSADLDRIVVQKNGDQRNVRSYRYNELGSVFLSDGDVIVVSVKPDYGTPQIVEMAGEVRCPGTYPISQNSTSASQIIALAGGYTQSASPQRAFVVRLVHENRPNGAANGDGRTRTAFDIIPQQLASVRPGMNSALYWLLSSGDYSIIPLDSAGTDVILRRDDRIVVPEKERYVYVSGSVQSPGACAFSSALVPSDYIRLAGGYSRRADTRNAFVVRWFGEKVQLRGVKSLQEGDIIVVPEAEQFKRWNIFRDVVTIMASIATTALAMATFIASR